MASFNDKLIHRICHLVTMGYFNFERIFKMFQACGSLWKHFSNFYLNLQSFWRNFATLICFWKYSQENSAENRFFLSNKNWDQRRNSSYRKKSTTIPIPIDVSREPILCKLKEKVFFERKSRFKNTRGEEYTWKNLI